MEIRIAVGQTALIVDDSVDVDMERVEGTAVKIVVVGGGIIGSALTYRLAQAGALVTLLEAGQLGAGTSIASFAWLNANNKPPQAYHELNVGGMAEYHTLRKELGHAPWLHTIGNVEWDGSEDGAERLRAKVARLRSWGYQAELLPIEELHRLEPDMVAPSHVQEFAHFPTEGYIDPVPCIVALASASKHLGADIRTDCAVTRIMRTGDRVDGVVTNGGEEIRADAVVSCTGRWTDEFAELAGISVSMSPRVGLIALSAPAAVRLSSAHRDDTMFIRPDGAGRVMMRHYDFDDMVSIDTPVDPLPPFLPDLLDRVVGVLPGLAGTRIEGIRIAIRPVPADGYTIAGSASTVQGLYMIATHSAITMGALLGRLAAHEILGGEADPRLATFRPDRLVQHVANA